MALVISYLWFCLLNCLIKDAVLLFKGKNVNYMCVISSKITKILRIFWLENLFSEMWWQEVRLVLMLDGGFSFTML